MTNQSDLIAAAVEPTPGAHAVTDDIARIAEGLTRAQQTCGDVIDRLPCLRCGGISLKACTLPMTGRIAARDIINSTPGLHNQLLAKRKEMEPTDVG